MAVELYDDHEQSERVRNWISENGVSIVMGVVLALAGIFGWRQWQDYQVVQAPLAKEYYVAGCRWPRPELARVNWLPPPICSTGCAPKAAGLRCSPCCGCGWR